MGQANLRPKLESLDKRSCLVQHVCRCLLEKKASIDLQRPCSDTVEARIRSLEDELIVRYGTAFQRLSWHGPTSLQRIVWQDAYALELLADAEIVQGVAKLFLREQESSMGPVMTLGRAIFAGLAGNRPSYLLTASPNWALRPRALGVTFERLRDMSVPNLEQGEPFIVTDELLDAGAQVICAIQTALFAQGTPCVPQQDQELWDAAQIASTATLTRGVSRLLSLEQASLLMQSGNPSTSICRMAGQCIEVMHYYDAMLAHFDQAHERVLGFGLVSHALDAKHLVATLVKGEELAERPGLDMQTGFDAFRHLVLNADNERLGQTANALMRVRFQQVFQVLTDQRDRLGLTVSHFRRALIEE